MNQGNLSIAERPLEDAETASASSASSSSRRRVSSTLTPSSDRLERKVSQEAKFADRERRRGDALRKCREVAAATATTPTTKGGGFGAHRSQDGTMITDLGSLLSNKV